MRRISVSCGLALLFSTSILCAQARYAEQIEVAPPMPRVEAPSAAASAEELERQGDDLRGSKAYLDALDYYQAALRKEPRRAAILNKMGIVEMHLQRYSNATKSFRSAIKLDRTYSDAFNNLGVIYYLQKNYGKAIGQYERAVKIRPDSAAYYGNIGAAYFAKKDPEKAMTAYIHALQLDPDVLSRSSRVGVVGQTTPGEERAYYDYMVARAYAKLGLLDQSLEHLRKALEEQYKDIDKVYKDEDFAGLRKDPRFTALMTAKPPGLPE
jgi:tetratricopeptide (TPR) repeat protein